MMPIRSAAAILCAALAWPAPAHACDPAPYFGVFPDERGTALLVVATADTAAAGPGDVRGSGMDGSHGPLRPGTPFGQVVEVERAGGPAGDAIRAGRAVLVPWDYDTACRPAPWNQGARWLPPGVRDAVPAQLRRREHWVDGLPTFDVFSPHVVQSAGGAATMPDGMVDPAILFAYYARVPSGDGLRRDAWAAVEPLRAWLAANPAAAAHSRIRAGAGAVYSLASTYAVRAEPSPLAGTWRFELGRSGGPTHVLYARTARRPSHAIAGEDTLPLVFPAAAPAYVLEAAFRGSPSELPPPAGGEPVPNGDLQVRLPPAEGADGSLRFRGWLEPVHVRALFRDADPQLDAWAAERLQRYGGGGRPAPAEVVVRPDGRAEWVQVMEIGPGRVITLRGERISRDAWANAPEGG